MLKRYWYSVFFLAFIAFVQVAKELPKWLSSKKSACSAGDKSPIPGSGRCPGKGNGNPLQYSRLENSMDRGAWWASAHVVIEPDTT